MECRCCEGALVLFGDHGNTWRGATGRFGRGRCCVRRASGRRAGAVERTRAGTLIAVGGHLVVLSQDSGEVQIGPISASTFKPAHRSQVLGSGVTAATGPSFAGGRFFVRNIEEIVAFQLK